MQAVIKELPSLVDVAIPAGEKITVCGDTHGQFFDLMHIFDLNGLPSRGNPYVFNGDFVDRGSWSVEVIVTLMAWKVLDPACMHLTRGNHEAMSLNKIYGFEGEVKAKYNMKLMDVFRCAPPRSPPAGAAEAASAACACAAYTSCRSPSPSPAAVPPLLRPLCGSAGLQRVHVVRALRANRHAVRT